MRASVFGLSVHADRWLPFLDGASRTPTERPLRLRVGDGRGELSWPDSAVVICERRGPHGSTSFSIESHATAGYLIRGSSRGSHLLSADGRRLTCEPGGCESSVWERFLVGQVLPFAALVSGLEIFHASAVVLDGAAIALAGPSGAGKTSVALALRRAGAGFLADDVLALEAVAGAPMAYPGTPVMGIKRRWSSEPVAGEHLSPGEVVMSGPDESVARMHVTTAQAPLEALFFLERCRDGPSDPRFEAVTDSRMLLGATFNFVFATSERLRGLLDVCALVAERRVERIVAGPSVDADELAAALLQRLGRSR